MHGVYSIKWWLRLVGHSALVKGSRFRDQDNSRIILKYIVWKDNVFAWIRMSELVRGGLQWRHTFPDSRSVAQSTVACQRNREAISRWAHAPIDQRDKIRHPPTGTGGWPTGCYDDANWRHFTPYACADSIKIRHQIPLNSNWKQGAASGQPL